ncbi:response regulator [Gloeothece verrucosa]|uniref:Response regulator receiver protein n=1 Tax=Gloeothece verrucosa (strain PCC 7822) TaxID=497965 RepID=E0UFW7_GLOV7|nr:response regulator [Gloeothece verrucosa]ADN14350.1 response regulator receiver protein [Gloeothece verrucosa PCC 7822]
MNNQTHSPKGKVLIADDDEDSRLLLNVLLSEEGWQVCEAKDGQETLSKVSQESPDILILDNRMPELSGTEVYQYLRQKNTNLAIILITAYPDLEQLAASLGITYFLNKPFNFSDLFDLMNLAYKSLNK